jgi:cytochrome c oxidase subunit 3
MTFILIFSSVTMVLAVDAGHQMQKNKVVTYMALTILGGLIFVGSQAWEWTNFIKGEYGAVELRSGKILQFVDANGDRIALEEVAMGEPEGIRQRHLESEGIWYASEKSLPTYTLDQVKTGFAAQDDLRVRTMELNEEGEKTILDRDTSLDYLNNRGIGIIEGANMSKNEYGAPLFADFFFFITGFHGFHVFSGVVILCIVFFNVLLGTYEKRGSYEMVEKVGLYWHFVDLVWVFVFTFFYLV